MNILGKIIFTLIISVILFIVFITIKKNSLKNIKKDLQGAWPIIAIIFGVILIKSIVLIPGFKMVDDEASFIIAAQKILKDLSLGEYYCKSTFWPFFIACILKIIGPRNMVILYLNIVLSGISIGAIYLLSKKLFKNEIAAYSTAIFLALSVLHMQWSLSLNSIIPAGLFVMFSLIAYINYYRKPDMINLWLALAITFLTVQIRIECSVLFVIFLIGQYIYKVSIKKEQILSILSTLILLVPFYVKILPKFTAVNWDVVDGGLSPLIASNWSISNIYFHTITIVSQLFTNIFHPLILSMFVLIGLHMAWNKYRRETIFLLWSLFLFYVATFTISKTLSGSSRVLLNIYNYLLLWAGYGFFVLFDQIRKRKGKFVANIFSLLVLMLFILRIGAIESRESFRTDHMIRTLPVYAGNALSRQNVYVSEAESLFEISGSRLNVINVNEYLHNKKQSKKYYLLARDKDRSDYSELKRQGYKLHHLKGFSNYHGQDQWEIYEIIEK
ncbi:glycosyltransferase family 39 protein [Candidatus Margulisiibacteriota bacterium]